MKYKIYNWYDQRVERKFDDWWEMIGWISENLNSIAHSRNDTYAYLDCGAIKLKPLEIDVVEEAIRLLAGIQSKIPEVIKRYVYCRHLIVYDEFERIVNLHEIKESAKIYKPRYKSTKRTRGCYFEYRKDPVPYIHKRRGSYYRKIKTTNRKYYLDLTSWMEDSRTSNIVIKWNDEYPRFETKSWKQNKKRKQWM